MKAEQRHQLQTNYLADQMGKLWQGSKASSSGMLWGVLLVVVAVAFAFWWLSGSSANRISATWISWWDSRSSPMAIEFMPDTELEKMADVYKGTAADNAARLTLADQLYEKGYQTTFKESATAAAKHYEEAFKVYDALSGSASSQEVALRALIGAARCKESLGQVDEAKALYEKVVDRYAKSLKGPDGVEHPLVADAQQRVASFENGDAKAFYADASGREPWPKRLPPVTKTNVGPLGEMPPLPDPFTPAGDVPPPPPTFPETQGAPLDGPPPPPLEKPAPPTDKP